MCRDVTQSGNTAPRPNIIHVMADDMGYGDFGLFNGQASTTPALDELSLSSLCLTQHYSASCVCTPARAGLFTGRYPQRTGAVDMRANRGLDRIALGEQTLADCFQAAGYATGLVGKWHNGVYGAAYHPCRRGFDEFLGFRGGAMSYADWRIEHNGTFERNDGRNLTDVLTDGAIDFIARHRKRPFFLCLHYNAPHAPLEAPEEDIAEFLESGQFTRGVSIVYALIKRMDAGIERLRNALARRGLAENTLFLFTSDNGPDMGLSGEICTIRHNSGFRGAKCSVYEGGIRVPCLVHWPAAGFSSGRQLETFVHFTDWLPTFLAAADIPLPAGVRLDGQNVLPALQGEPPEVEPRRFWQWNRYAPVGTCNAAMRNGNWKLVRPAIAEAMWTAPEEADLDRAWEAAPETVTDLLSAPLPERSLPPPPPPQLYDLAQDPGEEKDLADAEPQRVRRMLAELERWFADVAG